MANGSVTLPDTVRSAFRGGLQHVELKPQFRLYKFTDSPLVGTGPITPWWAPVDPYGEDPGLESRLGLARHLGANPGELMRVVAAVKETWPNKMDHLLKAELLKPVTAVWGQCATQRRRDDGRSGQTENLPGYAWQFYIPNLTANEIRQTGWTEVSR